MRVYIGPYPNRMICRIHTDYMNDKYGYVDWPTEYTKFESFLEKLEDAIQSVYNCTINLFLDRREQKIKVRIDKWDTWSMDNTLAHIVLPMLIQLKKDKHGACNVDAEDVPKELRPKKQDVLKYKEVGEVDNKFFERWDWVMDEMIWAFEQKTYDWEAQYYGEWKPSKGKPLGGHFLNSNDEARKKHQERMSNGFRLFGKYYEGLWD